MPDPETLVSVTGASKKFCRDLKRSLFYGVEDVGREMLCMGGTGDKLRPKEFWAVDDVSFELKRGECLGLIGRNGAGKTTLLKMLNGLIKPDKGEITIRGRVGALIALNAGFNPILTGRENIYVNGAVLGLSKREIDAKFDEIVDFSELEQFIDTPVQSYSSGMQVRLGFAVATSINPDILIIDEVLAVGDSAFRHRCYKRIAELKTRAAVILVSHNMSHIQHVCNSALVMNGGKRAFNGDTTQAVETYAQLNTSIRGDDKDGVEITGNEINDPSISFPETLQYGEEMSGEVKFISAEHFSNCSAKITITDSASQCLLEYNTQVGRKAFDVIAGNNCINFSFGRCHLRSGTYHLNIAIYDSTGLNMIYFAENKLTTEVSTFMGVQGNLIYFPS